MRKPKRKKIIVRDWRNYSKEDANAILNEKMQKISTSPDLDLQTVQEVYNQTLDIIAPFRVIRVTEGQLINPKIEALKKGAIDILKNIIKITTKSTLKWLNLL
jgi:hypothetical protein